MPGEEVWLVVLVAGGDQLLQAKEAELTLKETIEVRDGWVVAIAVDHLPAEMIPIIEHFPLDVP